MSNPIKYHVYTDGACSCNPGPGSYAFIVFDQNHQYVSEGSNYELKTTNNIMELRALIESIKYISTSYGAQALLHTCFYSDSKYVVDGYNKWLFTWRKRGWKSSGGCPVKNLGFWQELNLLAPQYVQFIKGHNGNKFNEAADFLAKKTLRNSKLC